MNGFIVGPLFCKPADAVISLMFRGAVCIESFGKLTEGVVKEGCRDLFDGACTVDLTNQP